MVATLYISIITLSALLLCPEIEKWMDLHINAFEMGQKSAIEIEIYKGKRKVS